MVLLAVALALMVLVTISVTVFVAIVGKGLLQSDLARVRDTLGRPAVGQRATRMKKMQHEKADGRLLYFNRFNYHYQGPDDRPVLLRLDGHA